MGWVGDNPLLFATLILLVVVGVFGVIIFVLSLYIGICLGVYLGFSYALYSIPGILAGIIAVLIVVALLVMAAKKKTSKKVVMIVFAVLLGLLAFAEFVFGLAFLTHDYEGKDVEFEGHTYKDNADMYADKWQKDFKEALPQKDYGVSSLKEMPGNVRLDALQRDFGCCGLHNYSDYYHISIIPLKSCCSEYKEFDTYPNIYCKMNEGGCVRPFWEWLTSILTFMGVVLFIGSLFTIGATVCVVILIVTGAKITPPE